MLPEWLIKKIDKKKEKFIQEELRIEEYPMVPNKPRIEPKEEERVIVIDLF
jgi:hypothetical protein